MYFGRNLERAYRACVSIFANWAGILDWTETPLSQPHMAQLATAGFMAVAHHLILVGGTGTGKRTGYRTGVAAIHQGPAGPLVCPSLQASIPASVNPSNRLWASGSPMLQNSFDDARARKLLLTRSENALVTAARRSELFDTLEPFKGHFSGSLPVGRASFTRRIKRWLEGGGLWQRRTEEKTAGKPWNTGFYWQVALWSWN